MQGQCVAFAELVSQTNKQTQNKTKAMDKQGKVTTETLAGEEEPATAKAE